MNISDDRQTGTPENNRQQEPREAPKPPRHADWISYAVAVTQQPQTVSQNAR
ncbi:hypothetical protein [Hymenobacter daeguensis]